MNRSDIIKKVYKSDSLVEGIRKLIGSKKEPPPTSKQLERSRKYKHYFYKTSNHD